MATKNVTKIGDKLSTVNDSFTINRFDNGFMVEVSGRDANEDWKTVKIVAEGEAALFALIKEYMSINVND